MKRPPNGCECTCQRRWTDACLRSSVAVNRGLPSQRVLPGARQPHGTVDDTDHAVGLRVVTPHLTAPRGQILRHQANPVAAPEHLLEQLTRLPLATDAPQRVDVPESTDAESHLWHA